MAKLSILLLGISLLSCAASLLEDSLVTFHFEKDSVPIHDATIVYAEDDPIGISIAAEALAEDLEQITGTRPPVLALDTVALNGTSHSHKERRRSAIIASTLDSALAKQLIQADRIQVSDIEGKWETYKSITFQEPMLGFESGLLIVGSDRRAAMFGLYALAEQCGQSPYHWWADVPATRHDEIYALPGETIHGEPSVKYRGLFINDEAPALMTWWARKHNETVYYPLDTEFYRHVFDLILRLKGNFMWPAMWPYKMPPPGNIFFLDDPENQQLADDYGIVVSTSHHEPMQRATNEWDEEQDGPWDWVNNKENVVEFMEEGVRRAGNNATYFTLGMRGPHDGPIEADDPVEVLRDVFETQRSLLSQYYGNEAAANQVWTIYKEVATYYAAGLNPPEDVTLMFSDDNFGNIQRLPTAEEAERPGGVGIYFHLEYVGSPRSYKWHNTNNLAKVLKELYHAYQRGADQIWVINVADIKPMELPFNFIMDYAWNTSSLDFGDIPRYLKLFATREFGPEYADEISSLLMTQSRLVGRRNFESISANTYAVYNYDENQRVLREWKEFADNASAIGQKLSEDLQAAFYHLVLYPAQAGYQHHRIVLGRGRNLQYALERRNSANDVANEVFDAFERDYDLIEEYDRLRDGKCSGMASQPRHDTSLSKWDSPFRDALSNVSFVQLRQNSDYDYGNIAFISEAGRGAVKKLADNTCGSIPPLDSYGPSYATIDVAHRGDYRVPIEWSIQSPESWLAVDPSSGVLSRETADQTVQVSVDWDAIPNGFNETLELGVTFNTTTACDRIHVPIRKTRVPDDFTGFPETGGMISMEASHFQRSSDSDVSFHIIPHLGSRTDSGAIALRPYAESRKSEAEARKAWVEYDVYVFDDADEVEATVYITSGLDTDPDLLMEFSLAVDAEEGEFQRVLGDPESPGDVPPGWKESVEDNVWTKKVTLGPMAKGKHTLRWSVNSPEVYLEKIICDTRGGVFESYLGPPETTLVM